MSEKKLAQIALIRHGETDWNRNRRLQGRTEIALNDTGVRQVHAAGTRLSQVEGWQAVYTSPLLRARQSAQIIAQQLNLAKVTVAEELIERFFGGAEGMPVEEANRRWPDFEIPGAEPLKDLRERAGSFFERMLNTRPGAVLVAHGALIRNGLIHVTGADIPRIANGQIWVLGANGASVLD